MDDVRKKIFVIDTSVLIEDPDVLFKLGGNEIVIPTAVLKELDGLTTVDNYIPKYTKL